MSLINPFFLFRKQTHFSLTKGPKFALEVKTYEATLTADMIARYEYY